MSFHLFFPSDFWEVVLLVLSVCTVALAGLRLMFRRSKSAPARRIRSYGVPLLACLLCCVYGAYLNKPRTLDRNFIAAWNEFQAELRAKGQGVVGGLSVLSGFPFAWYQASIDPVQYKFIGSGRTYVLRLCLSGFVIAASMVALAALLWHVSEVSLLHLILVQTIIALVVFLHVAIDPDYHWATSATLMAAPQLVYLLTEFRRGSIAFLGRYSVSESQDVLDSSGTKSCENSMARMEYNGRQLGGSHYRTLI